MFEATTSPWYLPTWVSSRTPVTSPTAHRRSPARRCASTPMPCGPAWTPTASRPPGTRGPAGRGGPRAGGDEQPVAARLAVALERYDVVFALAPRGGRVHAEDE